jgi:hypothetical protein
MLSIVQLYDLAVRNFSAKLLDTLTQERMAFALPPLLSFGAGPFGRAIW